MCRPYFSYLGFNKSFFLFTISILASLLVAFNYLALIPVLKAILGGDKTVDLFYFKDLEPYIVVVILVFLFVLKNLFVSYQAYLNALYNADYMNFVRSNTINSFEEKYFVLKRASIEEMSFTSSLIPRIDSFYWAVIQLLVRIGMVVPLMIYLVVQYPIYIVFVFLMGFIWLSIQLPLMHIAQEASQKFVDTQKSYSEFLMNYMLNFEVLSIHLKKNFQKKEFEILSEANKRSCSRTGLFKQLSVNSYEIILFVGIIAVIVAYSSFDLQIIKIASFGFILSKLVSLISEISTYLANMIDQQPYVQKLGPFLEGKSSMENYHPSEMGRNKVLKLAFEKFTVYKDQTPIFSPITNNFQNGDFILLSGPNGSGKSSFIKGLCQLINYDGKILLNDQPLTALNISSYVFSYSPQKPSLSNSTIIENILEGSSKTNSDLQKLVEKIGLNYSTDFFSKKIENFGEELSGGQLQLVSILRALIREFEVLILDEYKNHLSQEVLEKINVYISNLKGKIVFVIAHNDVPFCNTKIQF